MSINRSKIDIRAHRVNYFIARLLQYEDRAFPLSAAEMTTQIGTESLSVIMQDYIAMYREIESLQAQVATLTQERGDNHKTIQNLRDRLWIANNKEAQNEIYRKALELFVEWNAKYPSSRIYSETSIRKIAAELDKINEIAQQALVDKPSGEGIEQPECVTCGKGPFKSLNEYANHDCSKGEVVLAPCPHRLVSGSGAVCAFGEPCNDGCLMSIEDQQICDIRIKAAEDKT